ncbi:alpha/beta hydrolase [Arthrobacter sp. MSA 4-2]|uniref:alpha/beta fold hydrolase n=1 Tax=Arthrobacter sp. MSA 4-2 TaxID=2794349 RepID=UPI0018E84E54|nr:alpha/beta hydrolase [Arthrobacter sp. MSA 4-2]MBJ2119908.1 alpha/beta hydrolase [Arthrobacter sp. MSA 4-2]
MRHRHRADAGIDPNHDRQDRERGHRIRCDTHVLWGERAVVNRLFRPLERWQAQREGRVTGEALPSGHFIPEELPAETAGALKEFLGR